MSISEKLITITENVPKVYEKGKKDEYDKFWDVFQANGSRIRYNEAFSHGTFDFRNFYPKYDINIRGNGTMAFYNWKKYSETFVKGSLKQRLDECGVKLDTSQATNLHNCFSYGLFTELPTINLTGLTSASSNIFAYNYDYLKTIEKIIISENTVISTNWFTSDTGLKNLTIEGTIEKSNFSVKDCKKLTVASLLSILTALSKDQSIASGKTVTFADNHLSLIQADEDCLSQLSSAASAGWSIFFGTTKYEG